MRTPPAGTVPFGGADYESDAGSPRENPDLLEGDDRYYRGKQGAAWVTQIPVKLDMALLQRGQERYEIYCAPCHGATGIGQRPHDPVRHGRRGQHHRRVPRPDARG